MSNRDLIGRDGSLIKIMYDDDPNQEKAGLGLESFPLINQALERQDLQYWMMSPSEQVALLFLLGQLRPKIAIEIGTAYGGSLQALSRYSDHVYSIDVNADVPRRLAGQFANVEYLVGPSRQILPQLLHRLQSEAAELAFALVDGAHSTEGVRDDIDNLLQFRPAAPLYVIVHDSFNPQCRLGIKQANWHANPYVHAVELDFVAGTMSPTPAYRRQLWGGLALAILLPDERRSRFEITARAEQTFRAATAPCLPE